MRGFELNREYYDLDVKSRLGQIAPEVRVETPHKLAIERMLHYGYFVRVEGKNNWLRFVKQEHPIILGMVAHRGKLPRKPWVRKFLRKVFQGFCAIFFHHNPYKNE